MPYVKRIFFLFVLIFLTSALFHIQILGAAARLVLKMKFDCELAYCTLAWENGELVFSDLVLFDSSFHTRIQRASIRFDWSSFPKKMKGHLIIDQPHLSFTKKRGLGKLGESWFLFSINVRDGLLDWNGPVHFSLDHQPFYTKLDLNWDDSFAFLNFQEEKLECELKNFQLALLNGWIPFGKISDGQMTGHILVDAHGAPLSANVKIDSLGFSLSQASFEQLGGTFSFNNRLGAKWEFNGIGKARETLFPFSCEGKGFFVSQWLDAKIRFDDSWCHLAVDESWNFECHQLLAEQASWLQQGLSAIWPQINDWNLIRGILSAKASWTQPSWSAEFKAENFEIQKGDFDLVCDVAQGELTQEGGNFFIFSKDYSVKFAGAWEEWSAEARVQGIRFALRGGWDGEKSPIVVERGAVGDLQFAGNGWICSNLDLSFALEGEWNFLEKQIPFKCPNFSKQGSDWHFDFRCVRKTWDLLRVVGTYDGKKMVYSEMSHLLGVPLCFASTSPGDLDVSLELPWKAVLSAGPFLRNWGVDLRKVPVIEKSSIRFQLNQGLMSLSAQSHSPPFHLAIAQKNEEWQIQLESEIFFEANLKKDGNVKGRAEWKTFIATEFDGKIFPSLHCEFSLPKVAADLKLLDPIKIEGKVEGQGHFIYNGQIESDFDLDVSSVVVQSYPLENKGPVHLSYSSIKGALFTGIDLHGKFDCIIDLLQYDLNRSHWIFQSVQVHLPGSFLPPSFLPFIDLEKDLNFTADLDVASDLSAMVCYVAGASIPYHGAYHQVENLNIAWDRGKCRASFYTLGELFSVRFQIDETITGRLALGEDKNPLVIDWVYGEKLLIQSMEGSFAGIDASFHAEAPNLLVGSARLDFATLKALLPVDVSQVFDELKMGKGYELKGRLKIENNIPSFRGILSGKSLELFGFQFRTLLAQVDLGPELIRIFDLKISDSAGILKIDELMLEGKDNQPWTIAIPNLTILEMRPSLLQRPGGAAGSISPLVVRQLTLTDFKGLLDDGKTYTAQGKLRFINSYKRGETVFDLPANVLSRIVGLDLDLLIPVTGNLEFNLKDGYFNLLELTDAYSEAKRSQFFLEMNPPPRMDLDGNLQIFIKMKQFVLLKITESLLISIDGVLNEPKYHLKKRRFFGLMES
jgi:hypothetical protein